MATETLHFRVAEDAGKLIMNIAQEHLIYNYDPQKAMKAITDSLTGCPTDLALQILKGDMVVLVDVDEQMFYVDDRNEVEHSNFPKIDVIEWYKRQVNDIVNNGKELKETIKIFLSKNGNKYMHKTYSFKQIVEFANGNEDDILEDLRNCEEIEQTTLLLKVTKAYIEKSMKLEKVLVTLEKWYPQEFEERLNDYDLIYIGNCNIIPLVVREFSNLLNTDLREILKEEEELHSFIDAQINNDKVISKGIEPVNIMDNYSAGWLAPNGDFYGLNGEIANMLHNSIADALREIGIVPNNEEYEVNADSYLNKEGWVRIHGNYILFEGFYNSHFNMPNITMTPIQIKKIYEYGALCHNGMLKIGLMQEYISAIRFKDMSENDPNSIEKFFKL
jgi:hypothetical protein